MIVAQDFFCSLYNFLTSDQSLQWCNQKVNFYSGPKGGFLARAQEKRQRLLLIIIQIVFIILIVFNIQILTVSSFIYEILRHAKTRKPYIPLHNIAKFKCVYTNFGSKTLIQSSFT